MQRVLRQDGTVWFGVASTLIQPRWTGEHLVTIAPSEDAPIEKWIDVMAYEIKAPDGEIVWREMH